jgi:hypothetical protein
LIKKQTNKTIIKYLIYLLGEFGGVGTPGGGPTGPGRGPGGGVGGGLGRGHPCPSHLSLKNRTAVNMNPKNKNKLA